MTLAWLTWLFVLFIASVDGSAIHFNSSSTSIKPLITKYLTLTCLLKDTSPNTSGGLVGRSLPSTTHANGNDDITSVDKHGAADDRSRRALTNTTENIDFVTSIAISQDGVDIAIISEHVAARAVVASPNIQVTGSLTGKPGVRGMLQITWPMPTNLQAGKYKCDVDTINSMAHSFDFSQTIEVAEEEVSLTDLVNHVHALVNHVDDIERNMSKLENENGALRQKINQLEYNTNISVFFSAGVSASHPTYSDQQVVLYDRVFTNEGAAYNPSTGVFTCPKAGFYQFDVDAATQGSSAVALYLQQNNNNKINIVSSSGHGYQTSSNTVILKLAKGDTVRVISYVNSSYLYASSSQIRNTFSGHLLAVV